MEAIKKKVTLKNTCICLIGSVFSLFSMDTVQDGMMTAFAIDKLMISNYLENNDCSKVISNVNHHVFSKDDLCLTPPARYKGVRRFPYIIKNYIAYNENSYFAQSVWELLPVRQYQNDNEIFISAYTFYKTTQSGIIITSQFLKKKNILDLIYEVIRK